MKTNYRKLETTFRKFKGGLMTKEEIVQELRSIIFDYQKTMTKDTEQSLKNLIDAIEGYNK